MNNQTQLGRNAVITFEKTLQDIRKAFILPVNEAGQPQGDAQAIIDSEEKLALIDARLAQLNIPNEEQKESQ